MISDILNTDKKYITQNLVQYISTKLGERHCTIHLAFSSCVPIIFSGILIKSADTSSIEPMLDLIVSKNRINPDFLNNPELIYTNNEKILKKGQENLSLLFGNKTNKITHEIIKTSGVQPESAKTLMDITMAITLAVLGIKANSEGWNSNEVLNYVIQNQKSIEESTPSKVKEIIKIEEVEIEEKSTVLTSQKRNKKTYWVKYAIIAIIGIVLAFTIKNGCTNNLHKSAKKSSIIPYRIQKNQTKIL
jgi:hypothetical protein